MKKNVLKFLGILVISSVMILSGCSKKEGCTDPDAKNYDPDAKKSTNSCQYEGSIVFWYKQTVSEELLLDDITSLAYYVDGKLIGSSSSSVFFNSVPDCNTSNVVKYTADLGNSKSKSVIYQVKDPIDGELIWEGTTTLKANTCVQMELTY